MGFQVVCVGGVQVQPLEQLECSESRTWPLEVLRGGAWELTEGPTHTVGP